MPEKKTIGQLKEEIEELERKQSAQESEKRNIALANEIAAKLGSLNFFEKLYVLKVVIAMINTSVNIDVSLKIGKD